MSAGEYRAPGLSLEQRVKAFLDSEVTAPVTRGLVVDLLAALDEVRAGVVTEEPEWETECVEEARIHYRYGVNSGTLAAWNTPESIAAAIEDHERRTMGRIGVQRIDTRTKITHTSPWVPVEQEGAGQ